MRISGKQETLDVSIQVITVDTYLLDTDQSAVLAKLYGDQLACGVAAQL